MANLRTDNLRGVGFISANDGTVWSNLFDGSTLGSYPVTNAFDGSTSNFMYPAAGTTITWNAPNGGIKAGLIEVYVYAGNTHPIILVNGVSTGAVVGSDLGQQGNWVDVTSLVGGNLKTITSLGQTIGGVARQSGFSAVRINGEILVDGLIGKRGGEKAISGSVFFDGNSHLEIASSSDFAYGTGDFTWEAWVLLARGQSTGYIFDHGNDGGTLQYESNNVRYYNSTTGNSGALYDDGGSIDYDGWYHLAVARSSGTTKLFVNGIQKASASDSHNYSAQVLTIGDYGANSGTNKWKGYISNARICKGHAVYTASFTPPTSELEVHYNSEGDETVLLCCQDSDDPTKDTAGRHTITAFGGSFQTGNQSILINSDFSQGTTGFTGDSGASISESGGVMTVTNGGGDNLYALKQNSCLRIGGTYRCTATVTPTFASGNPVFRVRFGGSAESFVQTQATMSTGVAFRLDTGEKVADGTDIEIGSGNSSGITQFTITDLVVTVVNPPIPVKNIPPVGVDAGNTFGGAISMNSSSWMYFPTGRTEERGRGRAVIMGGIDSSSDYMTRIDFLTIPTMGNSIRFGDLSFGSRDAAGAVSSTNRAVYAGGMGPGSEVATNSMSFITIATQGNGTDYGDLTAAKRQGEGCSNGVRGIFMGGENDSPSPGTYNNVIDFCTIASIGNASDFGDLTAARDGGGVCSSPIRGVCGGGYDSGNSNIIDFVTIATTGNASDFGDLTTARTGATGCASATRGLFMGGRVAPNNKDEIDFITIASTGNASDFGDLQQERIQASATASQTRGVHIGGNPGSSPYNFTNMQFVTIASTGNASDFGETYAARTRRSTSDCHGGLS